MHCVMHIIQFKIIPIPGGESFIIIEFAHDDKKILGSQNMHLYQYYD